MTPVLPREKTLLLHQAHGLRALRGARSFAARSWVDAWRSRSRISAWSLLGIPAGGWWLSVAYSSCKGNVFKHRKHNLSITILSAFFSLSPPNWPIQWGALSMMSDWILGTLFSDNKCFLYYLLASLLWLLKPPESLCSKTCRWRVKRENSQQTLLRNMMPNAISPLRTCPLELLGDFIW